jgi:DtxR family Mn-dependent transcriptional regulator
MGRQRGKRVHLRKHFRVARFGKRLSDLGLTPGIKVTVVKSAPFNGPLEVNVRGSRLAIGRGMASRILVDVER